MKNIILKLNANVMCRIVMNFKNRSKRIKKLYEKVIAISKRSYTEYNDNTNSRDQIIIVRLLSKKFKRIIVPMSNLIRNRI